MTSGDERKVVTVLFADLVGSTELAQRHDPEVPPGVGQTLLAYGRFMLADDFEGRRLIERACGIFEDIEAIGWLAEARATLAEHESASG